MGQNRWLFLWHYCTVTVVEHLEANFSCWKRSSSTFKNILRLSLHFSLMLKYDCMSDVDTRDGHAGNARQWTFFSLLTKPIQLAKQVSMTKLVNQLNLVKLDTLFSFIWPIGNSVFWLDGVFNALYSSFIITIIMTIIIISIILTRSWPAFGGQA